MSASLDRLATRQTRTCVAIPVRDEAERIGACLLALSGQDGPAPDHVVLLINNTSDGTEAAVDRCRAGLRCPVTCVVRHFEPPLANAGVARAEAMRIAAGIAGPDGVLLSTDADGRVGPDWLRANLACLAEGAEVVCGRAEIDPEEAASIPAHLHEDDAREVAFGALIDHIHALADPDPFDPWPRHAEHSGASIAVTVRAWHAAGGVPALPSGEDRAFLAALRRVDRAIRHAPGIAVMVSGRTTGRASGGMADTMARRILCQDALLDEALEPAADALRRARARADFRMLRETGGSNARIARYAASLGLDRERVGLWLALPFMGQGWEALEAASPRLARRPVPRRALDRHRADALDIVAALLRDRTSEASAGMLRAPCPAQKQIEPVVVATVQDDVEPIV